jgi:hypothetical protein
VKIRNHHRWHLIVKGPDAEALSAIVAKLPDSPDSRVRMLVDRDPVALL